MNASPSSSGSGTGTGRLRRRRPVAGLVAAVLVLVGLLGWWVRPRDPDLAAVREAVDALLVTPAVRVRPASATGAVRADLRMTAAGEAVGDLVVDGRSYEFLKIGDREWLRSADDDRRMSATSAERLARLLVDERVPVSPAERADIATMLALHAGLSPTNALVARRFPHLLDPEGTVARLNVVP